MIPEWKDELKNMFARENSKKKEKAEKLSVSEAKAKEFMSNIIKPALEEVQAEFRGHGKDLSTTTYANSGQFEFRDQGEFRFRQTIEVQATAEGIRLKTITFYFDPKEKRHYKGEGLVNTSGKKFEDLTKEDIVQHVITEYKNNLPIR